MISIMVPTESWVAKWNGIQNNMPGVYAMNVFANEKELEDRNAGIGRRRIVGSGDEDDYDDSFIDKDGEGEDSYC